MLSNSSDIQELCKGKCSYEDMYELKPLVPFSEIVCDFLNDLSVAVMQNAEAKAYPDVITFGFFCRKGNIFALKKSYKEKTENRVGRGVSFHIAPSNVPINFAYSMVAALLAGNACIVRASVKSFRQVDIVCDCINKVLTDKKYLGLSDYICVVKYPRSKEINDYFSSIADIRVIWGGDNTVAEIRKSPVPPRSTEIAFADRYSIAVFNAEGYLKSNNKSKIVQSFYNDTYLYDQNACSSPRLIYWLGDEQTIKSAADEFWGNLHDLLINKYKIEPVIAVDKYMASCRLAIEMGGKIEKMPDNLINRIHISKLNRNIEDYRCAGGSFIEYGDTSLDALVEAVTRKYQTISYIGMDKSEIVRFIADNGLNGVDRIVPVGKTADFDLIWDGYDLILQMSRIISCI